MLRLGSMAVGHYARRDGMNDAAPHIVQTFILSSHHERNGSAVPGLSPMRRRPHARFRQHLERDLPRERAARVPDVPSSISGRTGYPRFVSSDNYASSFGLEWTEPQEHNTTATPD